MVGNLAQIYSPYFYDKRTGPRYVPAMVADAAFVLASICFATLLRYYLVQENRNLDALEMAEEEQTGKEIEGRKSPYHFRYAL